MYKYEMDPTRTVGATERTRDAGRTDGQTEWNQYNTPQQLRCVGGYNKWALIWTNSAQDQGYPFPTKGGLEMYIIYPSKIGHYWFR